MAAAPLAAAMYFFGAPAWGTILAAFASVLIDVDHLLDYLLHRRGWRGLSDFFGMFHARACPHSYYLLHAWEWVLLLTLAAGLGLGDWVGYLALGLGYHLLFDQALNKMPPDFYFLSSRARASFRNPHRRDVP